MAPDSKSGTMPPVSPRRKRIQVRILGVLLSLAGLFGWRAAVDYRHFQRALELRDRGHALSDAGRNAEAIPLLESCVQEYPQFIDAWTTLSEIYLEKKQFAEADRCLEGALKYCSQSDLDRAVIMRERGSLYLRIGEKDKAEKALAEAFRLDPTDGLTARLHSRSRGAVHTH